MSYSSKHAQIQNKFCLIEINLIIRPYYRLFLKFMENKIHSLLYQLMNFPDRDFKKNLEVVIML